MDLVEGDSKVTNFNIRYFCIHVLGVALMAQICEGYNNVGYKGLYNNLLIRLSLYSNILHRHW